MNVAELAQPLRQAGDEERDAARMGSGLESTNRVRPAVTLEILRQLGVLSSEQIQALAAFGPEKSIRNHREIVTGKSYPVFKL